SWILKLLYTLCLQAESCIRDDLVTGVQTCALPISVHPPDLLLHFFNEPRSRIPSADDERHKSSPGFVGLRKRGIHSGIRRLIQSDRKSVVWGKRLDRQRGGNSTTNQRQYTLSLPDV